MDEASGLAIGTTDRFFNDDPEAVAYLELKKLSGNNQAIRWDWHKPNGELYYSTGDYPIKIGKGKYVEKTTAWHKISIKGDPAANHFGRWQVKAYIDGKLIKLADFWIQKRLKERFGREPSELKGYVWIFDKPEWNDNDIKLYMNDFTGELLKKTCFFMLQRQDFERLLAQKKYEKEIRRIEDIPTDDLKKLIKHGANSVISIEIYDDLRGEINITARLNAFNHAVLAQESVQIPAAKPFDSNIRREKMKELAEKLSASIENNYHLIKQKLYGKKAQERTEKSWLKRKEKMLTQKISISPLALMQ